MGTNNVVPQKKKKFSKEVQDEFVIAGKILLLEILKSEGMQSAYSTAIREEKDFISNFDGKSEEIEAELIRLYAIQSLTPSKPHQA